VRASPALIVLTFVGACASQAVQKPSATARAPIVEAAFETMPDWKASQKSAATPGANKVGVRGIEGTLSNFDVKVKFDEHAREFTSCHEKRARKVPMLSGNIEFGIHVMKSGEVSEVDLRTSDVGDRELERCFVEIVRGIKFPPPHGGDANVKYTMMLGPAGKGREPEQWSEGRVQHVAAKLGKDLRQECSLERGEAYVITAYVNASGRVVAAGVAGRAISESTRPDCIVQQLASWPMPKPTKKRIAKVTFELRGTGRS
jgi:hypothetical protein